MSILDLFDYVQDRTKKLAGDSKIFKYIDTIDKM